MKQKYVVGLRKLGMAAAACLVLSLALGPTHATAQNERGTISDDQITRAVETDLIISDYVPAHLIDVETIKGVVSLKGSVDNLLAKDRARALAEATKGVRSVINQIEVAASDREDAEIRTDVAQALLRDPATDSYEVNVKVKDGSVTLTGEVESWQEHKLCTKVAKGVKGVTEVNNLIRFAPRADRPDTEIRADVKARLAMDALVNDALIDVEVDSGKVALSGAVGSAAEKQQALSDGWVTGVKSVDVDDLDVKWWARDKMRRKSASVSVTDAEIAEAIEDAFLYDPRVKSFNVEPEVDGGRVTLTGSVDNLRAKIAAKEDAQNTLGVWDVKNHIRVRLDNRLDDSELAQKVRAELLLDPYVDRFGITVMAINGKVYLYGRVDTPLERSRATVVASRVKGVVDVDNNITTTDEWEWKSDFSIKTDIESQLYWSPYVSEEDISVSVEDGTATLRGTVDDWFEWRKVRENARQAGADAVHMKVSVRSGPAYFGG